MIFAEFGRGEVSSGAKARGVFIAAYEKLCDELTKQTPRIVLVTPASFEKPERGTIPDLSARNEELEKYAQAISELAKRKGYRCLNVFEELKTTPASRSPAAVAKAMAQQLGLRTFEHDADGRWKMPGMETLRQAVIAKNRLWFDYWRPMNWAFLGGDRTFTQSSRDPNDLKISDFPAGIGEVCSSDREGRRDGSMNLPKAVEVRAQMMRMRPALVIFLSDPCFSTAGVRR